MYNHAEDVIQQCKKFHANKFGLKIEHYDTMSACFFAVEDGYFLSLL